MKLDIVLWTKNGERTLDFVLNRINKLIPKENVNNRILVNDHSVDSTPLIAQKNGWQVIENEGYGISAAANTALKHVDTQYFCSFEHDIILSALWWHKVALKIQKSNAIAISGVRFLPQNHPCYNIEKYLMLHSPDFGKTLDNTVWETEALRKIGGFPKIANAFCETLLHTRISDLNYEWIVKRDVESLHYHKDLDNERNHYNFYGYNTPTLQLRLNQKPSFGYALKKMIKSPITGAKMARKMQDNRLILSYPICRFEWARGYIKKITESELKC
jgi:glycosyltransferase involved in cell wall biosynthesis